MPLEQELNYFQANKADLLAHHAGKFALVHGQALVGTYTSFNEAFEEGVKQFGTEPFLVQHISDQPDQIQYPALIVGRLSAGL
jgi:hypothetical protein